MKIAFDLDNTIDANPHHMQSLMSALKAAGQHVAVVTGTGDDVATEAEWKRKFDYLASLGCSACWNELIVLAHDGKPIEEVKAAYLKDNGYDILFDNSKDNAKEATKAGIPLVLVPWASRF